MSKQTTTAAEIAPVAVGWAALLPSLRRARKETRRWVARYPAFNPALDLAASALVEAAIEVEDRIAALMGVLPAALAEERDDIEIERRESASDNPFA